MFKSHYHISATKTYFLLIAAGLFLLCCRTAPKQTNNISFKALPSSQTGINFQNTITENDSINLITNEYLYTGSGVGIGDFNNDGLPDVFLGGNQKSSRLYLNKGNFRFEDITEKAGLVTDFWATGISIVDINSDGYDDIYVCASGSKDPALRKNRLFINNHKLGFSEQAFAYGLADSGYATQAVFFDYDKDGDLDMYLVNHQLYNLNANTIVAPNDPVHAGAADRLYRNEGVQGKLNHPVFTDVSAEAGISDFGYGLGLVVSDFNNDNWPDLYVANDYIANDLLWLNNQHGGFTNAITKTIKHTSYSSMGVDAADINNDGWTDVTSLDMLPENNERQKLMFSFMTDERYELERRTGYAPEFMRNMLQLNNGLRHNNDTALPFFSEIGQFAGIHQTDWSWSVLMADLNNDGWKDMHITNGMGRDMLNQDFVAAFKNDQQLSGLSKSEIAKIAIQKLQEMGQVDLKNYCYQNNGDLTFANVSSAAAIDIPAVSNGCAYADLDKDGDLDLIVNNINKEAFVFANQARQDATASTNNYLSVVLQGSGLNTSGIGAKVWLYANAKVQYTEQNPVRGYMSSVDKILHFGVGNTTKIDSLVVLWSDDKKQTIKKVTGNQLIVLKQQEAQQNWQPTQRPTPQWFADLTKKLKLDYKHSETYFNDFDFQRLLPQKYSQLGPFITEGDVDGDGLTDFFVGGAYNQTGKIFIQRKDGSFEAKDLEGAHKEQEDLGCVFLDADGDKDLDLFVNSGGYEYDAGSTNYIPRLYKNDGKGNFTIDKEAIASPIYTSAQSVAAADFDGDGDVDIFMGGRVSPSKYPVSPRSYLLQNNGGRFTDVTAEVCPELVEPGMITAALWTNINNDKKPDLVIAGEWMPIRFFVNENGRLREQNSAIKDKIGQWRSLALADVDKDGDMDIVAGNLGRNNSYKASPERPIKLFAKDLDANGSIDPILAYYINDEAGGAQLYPFIGRDQFASQAPFIKKKYLYHKDYASLTIGRLFEEEKREDMLELTCNETHSCWIENKGDDGFVLHPLPVEAQWSPVNAILCTDIDKDGNSDLLLAGNEYQMSVMTGRYDASYGLFLKGDGKGNFKTVRPATSGFIIDGDVKDLKLLKTTSVSLIFAAVNNEPLKVFGIN